MSPERVLLPKARLESLVDGVFAIAMTLLVLEVRVPELADPRSASEMFQSLGRALPTLLAYFFSFGMLAIFWVWHHRLAAMLAVLDKLALALSLCFLALVSFFPFAAAVLGRYPVNAGSLAIYMPVVGGILLCQVAFFEHARRRGLLDPSVSAETALRAHRRNLRGAIIFCLCAGPSLLRLGWAWAPVPLAVAAALLVALRLAR